jgi:hypothetical protein
MKWWAIVLTVDALCALVAIVLSWIPAVALPITDPELVAFAVPGVVSALSVPTLRGRRFKEQPRSTCSGLGWKPAWPCYSLPCWPCTA